MMSSKEHLPFVLYGSEDQQRQQAALRAALDAWSAEWTLATDWTAEQSRPSTQAPCVVAATNTPSAALWRREAWTQRWPTWLSGETQSTAADSPIAAALERDCLDALLAALLAPLKLPVQTTWADPKIDVTAARQPGSGYCSVDIQQDGVVACSVLLWPRWSQAVCGMRAKPAARGGLNSRRQAVLGRAASLTIEAGQAELTVRQLRSLAVGDVVCLNQPLDRPLSVRGPQGQAVGRAYLGALHGQRAVQWVTEQRIAEEKQQ